MENHQPVHTIGCGAIRASIWKSDAASRLFHDVTFYRCARNGRGWSRTSAFGAKDLAVLAKVVLDAHVWIHAQVTGQGAAAELPPLPELESLMEQISLPRLAGLLSQEAEKGGEHGGEKGGEQGEEHGEKGSEKGENGGIGGGPAAKG